MLCCFRCLLGLIALLACFLCALLLALSYRREDGCDSEATCGLADRLAGLQPWARLGMAPGSAADGGGDGVHEEEGIRPSGGGGAFSEATILLPGEATPGPPLVATAPAGTFVAFRVPAPLPAHRRIRLRLPASTSIKTQWRGVTARGLKVHGENGEELSLGGR